MQRQRQPCACLSKALSKHCANAAHRILRSRKAKNSVPRLRRFRLTSPSQSLLGAALRQGAGGWQERRAVNRWENGDRQATSTSGS